MKTVPRVTAHYWNKRPNGTTACRLCPIRCVLKGGKTGVCMAKRNEGGDLIATSYGLTTTFSFKPDPMEKKPLYHFYPGTQVLSVGPNACNLGCLFCQNYQISQQDAPTNFISAEALATKAAQSGTVGVAYTYTEPLMWYEYILDAARAVKEAGMVNVLVSNGHLEPEPYDELLPLIDACNIDIKSMDPAFYRRICKGKLAPILRNVERTAGRAHIEITYLVIPTLNDTDEDFEKLARFMAGIDPYMPLHLSRYHPMYRMAIPATSAETLIRGADIAHQHLKYVFVGAPDIGGCIDTHCSKCGELLIARRGYHAIMGAVKSGRCQLCDEAVRIVDMRCH